MFKSYDSLVLFIILFVSLLALTMGYAEYGTDHPLSWALGALELPVLAIFLLSFVKS